jgi:hypothetical protein
VDHFDVFVKYLESEKLPEIFDAFHLSSGSGELISDLQTVDSPLMSAAAGLNTNCLSQVAEFESF